MCYFLNQNKYENYYMTNKIIDGEGEGWFNNLIIVF